MTFARAEKKITISFHSTIHYLHVVLDFVDRNTSLGNCTESTDESYRLIDGNLT